MEGKEKEVAKENADYDGRQTERSPFDILDEVEGEGDVSFARLSDDAESDLKEEQEKAEGEGTGLKDDSIESEESESEEEPKENEENEEQEEAEENEESEEAEEENEEEESEEEETTSEETPEWLAKKLKDINPDLDLSDSEAVQEAIDEFGSYKEEAEKVKSDLEAEREANKSFYTLLEGSDEMREVARFMHKYSVGFKDALTALDIQPEVDLDQLKKEDPDAYIEAVEAKKKRDKEAAEREEKQTERSQKIKKNEELSVKNTDEFKKENELDDKAFNEITSHVNPMIEDLADGLVTKDLLSTLHKGVTFDDAIAKAKQEGITEGKNMKIEEQNRKKQGDKLPNITGNSPNKAEKEEDDIFSKALQPQGRVSDIN